MENYIVINGERHDLVVIKGWRCSACSLYEQCGFVKVICQIFDENPVTGYDGYHFIKHSNH